MTMDCYDWELEQTMFEVIWIDDTGGHTIHVLTADDFYALNRVWDYCQTNGIGPKRKEDLKLTKRKLLL